MILDVVKYGDSRLAKMSSDVIDFDSELKELAEDMFETMREEGGIGLAAAQVGVLKRIFVADVPNSTKQVFVNPRIISFSEKRRSYEEGCLSIPGVTAEVERADSVVVEYFDLKGKPK